MCCDLCSYDELQQAHIERHDTSRAVGALAWQLVQRVDGGGMSHVKTKGKSDQWLSRLARRKGCEETTIIIEICWKHCYFVTKLLDHDNHD
jgi:hypothetical protein